MGDVVRALLEEAVAFAKGRLGVLMSTQRVGARSLVSALSGAARASWRMARTGRKIFSGTLPQDLDAKFQAVIADLAANGASSELDFDGYFTLSAPDADLLGDIDGFSWPAGVSLSWLAYLSHPKHAVSRRVSRPSAPDSDPPSR
jgi:hypothetical protein